MNKSPRDGFTDTTQNHESLQEGRKDFRPKEWARHIYCFLNYNFLSFTRTASLIPMTVRSHKMSRTLQNKWSVPFSVIIQSLLNGSLGHIGWWRTCDHKLQECDELWPLPFTEGNNVLGKNKNTLELEKEKHICEILFCWQSSHNSKAKKLGVKNG